MRQQPEHPASERQQPERQAWLRLQQPERLVRLCCQLREQPGLQEQLEFRWWWLEFRWWLELRWWWPECERELREPQPAGQRRELRARSRRTGPTTTVRDTSSWESSSIKPASRRSYVKHGGGSDHCSQLARDACSQLWSFRQERVGGEEFIPGEIERIMINSRQRRISLLRNTLRIIHVGDPVLRITHRTVNVCPNGISVQLSRPYRPKTQSNCL